MQCCVPFRKMKVIQVGENLVVCYLDAYELSKLTNLEINRILCINSQVRPSIFSMFMRLDAWKNVFVAEDVKVELLLYKDWDEWEAMKYMTE